MKSFRRFRFLVTSLVLFALLVPASVAVAEDDDDAVNNPNVYGIAAHAWWLDPEVYGDQLFPALDDLDVTSVRIGIDWKRFEPEPGEFDWAMYDRVFSELARRNIEIIANFNTIPYWASVDQEGCAIEEREIYDCELDSELYPEFENAIEQAVTRYAWIDKWEFWNEPEMWTHFRELTYLEYLRTFYDLAKEINPEIDVAASTLAGPDYIGWLYSVSHDWYGEGNAPWDVVAYHPYGEHFADAAARDDVDALNYTGIRELRDLMIEYGDEPRLWITEYGWFGDHEASGVALTQALDWLKRQPYIEHAHLHMLHDWHEGPDHEDRGLMAMVPDEHGNEVLDENTQFTPKKPFYNTFRDYPRDGTRPFPEREGVRYFSATGHTASGRFLDYWERRGDYRTIGLPLTRPYPKEQADGSWLLVQDFERVRMEYHPDLQGTEWEVLGTLIGRDITAGREDEEPFRALDECEADASRDCFSETGHSLAYGFRDFWIEHGGLARFGFPISEEFSEMNPDTGQMHTVQYFERARFEYHPDLAGTPFEVQLGLLIRDDIEAQGWIPPDSPRNPTWRLFE
ncbi:MAG: hypothetical protein EA415_07120 [Sphaerobacteraceae bacterium]|nr:MAG: hypothetical protein EA415_07120 [Sphaerobacteraceae bacterium]